MEENPSGSLPPAPSLSDETVRMARVLPLCAVGVTNDQPDVRITDEGLPPFDPDQPISPRNFPEVSTARGGLRFTRGPIIGSGGLTAPLPLEDDPEADPAGWWDDVARRSASLEPIVLEPVEGTLLEVAGTDPFVLWCRRILYASGVLAWLLILVPIVRVVWSELWF